MADLADGPDGEMLQAVTDALVALHERAVMLGDPYTDVEKTMIELQRQALVHETRSAFQQAMEHRFIQTIQDITGRRVARFISTHHVGPDLELELFLLEPADQS